MKVGDYNQRAIRALMRAQELRGVRSAEAFARLMAERANGSPSGTSYRRWLAGDAIVPAWALEVAAEVAETTPEALLSDEGSPSDLRAWQSRIEDAIGHLEAEMIEMREKLGLPWEAGAEPVDSEDDLRQAGQG